MNKNSKVKIYVQRELEEKIGRFLHSPEIIAILGARQAGKTTLMMKVFEGVKDDAVFLDFEDRELLSLFQEDIKAFAKLHVEGRRFIFIDEFQYAEEGGKLLKYLYDHYPATKFIISGSSGLDVTVKAVRYLVGRIFVFELFPFNFTEFLSFKEANLHKALYKGWLAESGNVERISQPLHKTLLSRWEEFSIWGGYPRVVLSDADEEKREVLKGIMNTYLLRDIRGVFQMGTEHHLQRLVRALALQVGNLIHYNELSLVSDLPYQSLKRHLSILEQTYILRFVVPYYTNKRLEVVKNPKVYFGDAGLRNFIAQDFRRWEHRPDKGALMENAVASELANKGAAIKFWRSKSKGEVDFVLEGADELIPIEVKAGRNQKPGKSLLSFMAKYSPSKALILYGGNIEIEQRRGAKIIFLPLYLAPLVSRLLEL